jgi:hypothetical protein
LAWAALAIAGCGDDAGRAPTAEEVGAYSPPQVEALLNFRDFTVESRDDVGDPGRGLHRPASGGQFVLVSYQVANTGQNPAAVGAIPEIRLVDRQGRSYRPDVRATEIYRTEVNNGVTAKRAGEVNPGITVQDGVVFEIAKDAWAEGGWEIAVEGATSRIPLDQDSEAVAAL